MKAMKRLSVFLLAVLVLVMTAVPAFAASVYTPKAGTEATITETLYLEKNDTIVPTVSYKLELDGTTPKTEDGSKAISSEAYEGAPSITTDTVSFDSNSVVKGSGDNYQRYVTGDFKIDFRSVSFKEPGVYRWDLKKTSSGADANKASNNRATGYILAYVEDAGNDTNPTLTDVVYINSDSEDTVNSQKIGKDYKDQYPATNKDLTISKKVDGEKGSKSEYFEFTINLEGGVAGAKYKVSGSYQATTEVTASDTEGKNNTTLLGVDNEGYITLGNDGKYSGKVWLRHGQTVIIEKLAKGITYTTDESQSKGYTESLEQGSSPETGKMADSDVSVKYLNTKEGTTPTGIILQYGAPIAGILLVIIFMAFVLVGKKRREQEA